MLFFKRSAKINIKSGLLSVVFALSVALLTPLLAPSQASALTGDELLEKSVNSVVYRRALLGCADWRMDQVIKIQASQNSIPNANQIFPEGANGEGYIYPDGRVNCHQILTRSLTFYGWSDTKKFLEDAGYKYNPGTTTWTGPDSGTNRKAGVRSAIDKKEGQSGVEYYSLSAAARYVVFSNAFEKACNPKSLGEVSKVTNASYKKWLNDSTTERGTAVEYANVGISGLKEGTTVYFSKIAKLVKNSDGAWEKKQYGYAYQASSAVAKGWNKDNSSNGLVHIYGHTSNLISRSCHEIQAGMNRDVGAYLVWLEEHPDTTVPAVVDGDAPPATDEENTTTCIPEGIGWIICPILDAGALMTDGLYGWIENFLETPALNMDTSSSENTTYNAWKVVRNIANVAFVIAFLIIIFSQLTGGGMSNYGVKKMLPRLVIAAILVNISYWVTAIAIDASNIIGNNIYNLLRNGGIGAVIPQDNIAETITLWALGGVAGVAGGVALSVAASASLGWAAIAAVGVVILTAILALLIAFAILALRQAFIILAVVIAPLAFVAMLLPNTEKYFSMWRKSLTTLLVFYPLFALIFGGSYLASRIIIGSAGQQDDESATAMLVLIGAAVQFIPLFITPLLINFSSGLLGRVAGMVNNKNKGLIDRTKKIRDRKAKLAWDGGVQNKTRNPFSRAARAVQRGKKSDIQSQQVFDAMGQADYLESSKAVDLAVAGAAASSRTNIANDSTNQEYASRLKSDPSLVVAAGGTTARTASRVEAAAQSTIDEAETKAVRAASIPLQKEVDRLKATPGGDVDAHLLKTARTATDDDTKMAAMNMAASLGRDGVMRELKQDSSVNQEMVQSAIGSNAGSLVGKAPDLVKGAGPAFDTMNGKTLVGLSGGTAKQYVDRLHELHSEALKTGDTTKFNNAMSAFSASVEDIRRDPSLQGEFKGDVGLEIKKAFSDLGATSAGFAAYSPSSIDATGKIR